jgi:uncharacterized protein YjgD (DUF1641 family)
MKSAVILGVLELLNKRSKSVIENVSTALDIFQTQIPTKIQINTLEPVKEMYLSISSTLKLVKQLEDAGLIDVDSKGFFLREIVLSFINKIDNTGKFEEIEKLASILSYYSEWLKKINEIRSKSDSKDVIELSQKLIKGLL